MPDDTRLRRLKIRSWRRGTREMDLILGGHFDREGAAMSDADLDAFEALLEENDHDIYAWVSGRAPAPLHHAALIGRLAP